MVKRKKSKEIKKQIKRKKSSREYSVDVLQKAVNEVRQGAHLNVIAAKFGIPKSTLSIKVRNIIPIICKHGPESYLTEIEENKIEEWIIDSSARGFPVTKDRLFGCVQKLVIAKKRKTPFKNGRPGRTWYNSFMRRHPLLSERIVQHLTTSRAAVTEAELRQWFAKGKEYLQQQNLLNIESCRVFNIDEAAFKLVPQGDKVIAQKGIRNVYNIVTANEKACVTVLFNASANGTLAPPLILFELKQSPSRNILKHIPEGWGVGQTEGGWMTGDSFYSYIKNIFHPWLVSKGIEFPVIIYVDNHKSHITLQLLEFCKEKQLELVALYPNSTHILQPFDIAFFNPFKKLYKEAVLDYKTKNNIIDIKKYMVPVIIQKAMDTKIFEETIVNGFKSSGLYPFNADAVSYNILNRPAKTNSTETNHTENNKAESSTGEESNINTACLTHFENILSDAVLQSFQENELEQSWNGDPTLTALFEVWKTLRRQSEQVNKEDTNKTRICYSVSSASSNDKEDTLRNTQDTISIIESTPEDLLSCSNNSFEHVAEVETVSEFTQLKKKYYLARATS